MQIPYYFVLFAALHAHFCWVLGVSRLLRLGGGVLQAGAELPQRRHHAGAVLLPLHPARAWEVGAIRQLRYKGHVLIMLYMLYMQRELIM